MIELTDKQKAFFKQKCYFLTLVTYLDNVENIIVDNLDKIKKYAYAYHDKDDGKKPHTHIILAFSTDQTLLKYVKLFNTTEVTKLDKKGLKPMYDYLIHDTDKCRLEGKYQYDPSIRISNDADYFSPVKRVSLANNIGDMLEDIQRMSRRSFVCKYGFNALIHYDKILRFSLDCDAEDFSRSNGTEVSFLTPGYIINQSTGELIPVERRKNSKFIKKSLDTD